MKKRSKYMGLITFLALLALFSGTVSAAEWNVAVGGSVQAAVNTASNGDTIIVNDNNGSGYIYNENIVINKNISLQSKTDANVTVQALNSSKPVITVNSLGSGSHIQGFTITGATNSNGIFLSGTSNCDVNGNNLTWNYNGVYIVNSNNNIIQNNIATNNRNGILTSTDSTDNIIQNNTATNNRYGIFLDNGSSNNWVQNNILTSNSFAGITINYNSNTNIIQNSTIQNNILTNNYYGIYLSNGSSNSIVQSNTITNSTCEGIFVYGSVNNIIQDNTATNNRYGILLSNSQNNAIQNNTATNNQYGIFLYNGASNNVLQNNILTDNSYHGILINYNSNTNIIQNSTIQNNILTRNYYGIYLSTGSIDSIVRSNIVTANQYGVYISNSSANVNFNKISGNNRYGLYNTGNGTVNATNNWWGSNTDPSTSSSNIYANGGTVTYNPWIVLNVNVSTTNSYESTYVTADLTHNNQDNDTSSQGHIPNNLPVNFNTTLGRILNTAYTVKGKATTILFLNPLQTATATVTASTDYQNVSTTAVIATGSAILTITSTARDDCTNLPLNITYTIPLDEEVTWVSVLWKGTNYNFVSEVEIIVNGNFYEYPSTFIYSEAYNTWRNYYREEVFDAISFANMMIVYHEDDLENFWNNIMPSQFSLTSNEYDFIREHRLEFIDNITVQLVYPGISSQNITVIDAESSNVINLNFPGNIIQRTSQITYYNLETYEGVKSFAIATTEITYDIANFWAGQKDYYPEGHMKAAYGTFFTALMMIYCHDTLAEEAGYEFNVEWIRTSPIVVSAGDDFFQTYLTLDCDHSMGLTAVGAPEDVFLFKYVCSSHIPTIEYGIMNNLKIFAQYTTITGYEIYSVTENILNAFSSGTNLTMYLQNDAQNSYFIMKIAGQDNIMMVFDVETGIVRDIIFDERNRTYCGVYCFHDYITELAYEFFNDIWYPASPYQTWVTGSVEGYGVEVNANTIVDVHVTNRSDDVITTVNGVNYTTTWFDAENVCPNDGRKYKLNYIKLATISVGLLVTRNALIAGSMERTICGLLSCATGESMDMWILDE